MKKKIITLMSTALCLAVMMLSSLTIYAKEDEAEKTGMTKPICIEIDGEEADDIAEYQEQAEEDATEVTIQAYETYTTQKYVHVNKSNTYGQYTNDVIYNAMSSGQKQLYDDFYTVCENALTTNVDYSPENVEGEIAGVMPEVNYVQYGLSKQAAITVASVFRYLNPQFYFLFNGYATSSNGDVYLLCYDQMRNGTARASISTQYFNKVNSIVSAVSKQSDDYQKVKYANDYFCRTVTYDSTNSNNPLYQSSYSAVLLGRSVCAGYAQAMEAVLNAAGIDAIAVTSAEHEWNEVRVNGYWYVVDTTQSDDDEIGTVDYRLFMKSYASINSLGAQYRAHHTLESLWNGLSVPPCNYDWGKAPDNGYTGMKYENGVWYYYENGNRNTTYTGMANNEYGWWYFVNGQLDWSYTGLGVNQYGTWVYENGNLNFGRNGMVCVDGTWRYAVNGQITNYTGMACNEYGWWYYQNGLLDWTYTGMACNDYGWWYYQNGRLDWNYTGAASNQYGVWYYMNGNINWGYSGMLEIYGNWWYVVNGQFIMDYTGMACNEWGWWYYTNGNINWNYTGMACNDYGWWYYQNGRLDWNYTGFGYNQYGTWLYYNGQIAWGYTGDWYGHWVEGGQVMS